MFDFVAFSYGVFQARAMPTQRARKPIILVIDDYGHSREMLKLLLDSLNYRVLEAANGHEACAKAEIQWLKLCAPFFTKWT